MFPLCKRNFYIPAQEACLLTAGKPVYPGKALTTPKYICSYRISDMSICKTPFWKLGFCSCSAFSDNLLSKKTAENDLQSHLLFHAGVSISLRVGEFHPWGPSEKCVVTGKHCIPVDEAVQHLIWELCSHLPNLRQILNTCLFSIKILLSP